MRRLAAGVVVIGMVTAGCATGNTVAATDWPRLYTKAGGSIEQLETDANDCHWNAKGPRVDGGTAFWVGGVIGAAGGVPTAATHAACMQGKGYTVQRGPAEPIPGPAPRTAPNP